jgi:1-deoxy-D-xylulose-5-phosphate reductoisomerase
MVEEVMDTLGAPPADTLEAVLHWDTQARKAAERLVLTCAA